MPRAVPKRNSGKAAPSRQKSVVLPATGGTLVDRIKSRHASVSLQVHADRILDGQFPHETQLQFDEVLEQLDLKGKWRVRRIGWTAEELCIGSKVQGEHNTKLVEEIPLTEIVSVKTAKSHHNPGDFVKSLFGHKSDPSTPKGEPQDGASSLKHKSVKDPSIEAGYDDNLFLPRIESGASVTDKGGSLSLENIDMQRAVVIKTVPDGFNCGRSYIFRLAAQEKTDRFAQQLEAGVAKALKAEHKRTRFEESQLYFRQIWSSLAFQATVGVFIVGNFFVNCAHAQLTPEEDSALANTFEVVEICFTAVFTMELCLNAYAHWFTPFITDGWNILDTIVIAISIIAIAVQHLSGFSVLRLTRAFRILRLFGRLHVLKKIITGLMMSILPVVNAFLITMVVTMIYGIVGVAIFKDESEDFENFARAMHTLFLLVVGESWVESIPAFRPDGTLNHEICIYVVSYVLVVTWTLLQVGVAVLLDNYISATNLMELEAAEQRASDSPSRAVAHILDPLLDLLTRTYDSKEDLANRIGHVFAALDADESGDLSTAELVTGLKRLSIEPRIHASTEDIDAFFHFAGIHAPADIRIDRNIFEQAIRVHLHDYAQRMITDTMLRYHHGSLDPAVTSMASFKTSLLLLDEMAHQNAQGLEKVEAKLDLILQRLDSPHTHTSLHRRPDGAPLLLADLPNAKGERLATPIQDTEKTISVDLTGRGAGKRAPSPRGRRRSNLSATSPEEVLSLAQDLQGRESERSAVVLQSAPHLAPLLVDEDEPNPPPRRNKPALLPQTVSFKAIHSSGNPSDTGAVPDPPMVQAEVGFADEQPDSFRAVHHRAQDRAMSWFAVEPEIIIGEA